MRRRHTLHAATSSIVAAMCVLASATPARAQDIPTQGFHIGLGGSVNATGSSDQSIIATGVSDAYNTTTGALLSSGTATGPAVDRSLDSTITFAPTVQAGYFRRFEGTHWLLGGKASYQYLDATSTSSSFLVPQYGSFGTTSFTGNAVVRSFQVNVRQQVSLVPYVGRAFDKGYIYLGAGPTLSQVRTKIEGVIGFADINGSRTDISGTPQDFSSSEWVPGGAVTIGATRFFDSSWFVDLSYTYGTTKTATVDYFSTFNNVNGNTTYDGSLIGSSSGRTTTQTFAIALNKVF